MNRARLAFLLALAACRAPLHEVPRFEDGSLLALRAGFYAVRDPQGDGPLGRMIYLCPQDYVETACACGSAVGIFGGLRGVFHPNGVIESTRSGDRVVHRWFREGSGERGTLSLEGQGGTLRGWLRTDGEPGHRSFSLEWHGPRLARERIPTVYLAHRGSCYFGFLGYNTDGLYPGNTIPAFEASLASGYEGFELDLRVTKDGKFAVSHDQELSAATTLSGKVSERTLEELREACVVGTPSIPEQGFSVVRPWLCAPLPGLKEVLERFLGDERVRNILLDVKPDTDDRLAAALADTLSGFTGEKLLSKLIVVAHSTSALRRMREVTPSSLFVIEGDTGTEPFGDPEAHFPPAKGDYGGVCINLGLYLAPPTTHAESTRKLLEVARARGYATVGWTVNDAWTLDLLRQADLHADFLLSDAPYHRLADQQLKAFAEASGR